MFKKFFVPPSPLKTAVLLMVFNRIGTTKQVFEAIRLAKPPRLYIAADGARENKEGEADKVKQVRKYIMDRIDWECKVSTLFREKNLGCKYAVSGAINWFFENEEMGIILEDDCLPSQSFFWFCQELLNKYRHDTRVMHIAGMTYVNKKDNPNKYSYRFVRVGGIWGWATWRRAWQLYELNMETFLQAKKERIFNDLFIGEPKIGNLYKKWFDKAFGNNYTWDYQWTYTKLINSSLNIMPSKNLVLNIGHGTSEATHTGIKDKRYSNMELYELEFPLIHPKFMAIDRKFNYENFKYATKGLFINKIIHKIRHYFEKRKV